MDEKLRRFKDLDIYAHTDQDRSGKDLPPQLYRGRDIFEIIPDTDDYEEQTLNDLIEDIKKVVEANEGFVELSKIEPIAFGAKKIVSRILLKEKVGGTQPLEDAITEMENVQRAECSMVSIVS